MSCNVKQEQAQLLNEPDTLFITVKGKAENGAGIKHILRLLGQQYERRITMQLIRQSVLAIKLKKGNDIRMVQHFAGYKNASSTERYKAADIEELKMGISKYHPLQ